MTTWRDIADQLTEFQISYLERLEQDPLPRGLLAGPEQHLMLARGWAGENLEQSLHADVPPPEGAVEFGPWRKSPLGVRRREYSGAAHVADPDITLEIRGLQNADGSLECRFGLTGDGLGELDLDAVRQLAAALVYVVEGFEGR